MSSLTVFICCFCVLLLLVTGCVKEEAEITKLKAAAKIEVESRKAAEGATNVALNKTYAVNPKPNGYAKSYTTDATDGNKPISRGSCFGFSGADKSLDVNLDIDLGQKERIAGATLYTLFDKYSEKDNQCQYGANFVEVYGSENGNFSGEEKLLGEAGNKDTDFGEPGNCVFEIEFDPHECRYVRFLVNKKFGSSRTRTDWLFIKEAEVWKAAD